MNATTKAPALMITSALTGIGRATAQAFAQEVVSDCRERRNCTHRLNPTSAGWYDNARDGINACR
jgi:NAD(P)-dependent dehydrogenase (short-subunit alcohol dehydrogenase family)